MLPFPQHPVRQCDRSFSQPDDFCKLPISLPFRCCDPGLAHRLSPRPLLGPPYQSPCLDPGSLCSSLKMVGKKNQVPPALRRPCLVWCLPAFLLPRSLLQLTPSLSGYTGSAVSSTPSAFLLRGRRVTSYTGTTNRALEIPSKYFPVPRISLFESRLKPQPNIPGKIQPCWHVGLNSLFLTVYLWASDLMRTSLCLLTSHMGTIVPTPQGCREESMIGAGREPLSLSMPVCRGLTVAGPALKGRRVSPPQGAPQEAILGPLFADGETEAQRSQ